MLLPSAPDQTHEVLLERSSLKCCIRSFSRIHFIFITEFVVKNKFGLANIAASLTLILLTWTIWRAPTNASKWRMGFNSAFKGLI